MKQEVVYGGIDVAKKQLDVALGQERWRVPNTREGIAQLLKRFQRQRLKLHVICEASGGYEKPIVAALQKSTLAVSLVQANRVRAFARAAGVLAKTDQIDAAILVSFGIAMRLPVAPARANRSFARVGCTAPALEPTAKRRTKPPGSVILCTAAQLESQSHQQSQKADQHT